MTSKHFCSAVAVWI